MKLLFCALTSMERWTGHLNQINLARRYGRVRFLATLAAVLVSSCTDEKIVSVSPEGPRATAGPVGWQPDSAEVQLLAVGVAKALSSSAARAMLLEDLRDSPFERHTLELGSYLRGRRGRLLAEAAALASGVPVGRILSIAGPVTGPGLEIGLPRTTDQLNWRGTGDIAVLGTTQPLHVLTQRAPSANATTVDGKTVQVSLRRWGPVPLLTLSKVTHYFGENIEAKRAAAPKRQGKTVDSPGDGIGMFVMEPPPCEPDCGGGGGYDPGGPGYVVLPSQMTFAQCVQGAPELINATCRQELAWAFRPRLMLEWDEICAEREPYWTMKPGNPGEIWIFYALAYARDCSNRTQTADEHLGDSEFIIVRVRTQTTNAQSYWPQNWYLLNVTLSAHWDVSGWDSSWTGSPPAIEFAPGENLTRPKVYVAYGKHANYRDVGSCGRGANYMDDCSRATGANDEFGFPQGSGGDLGFNGFRVHDCVASRSGGVLMECFWSPSPSVEFHGWLGTSEFDGATNYSDWFTQLGFR